MGRGRGALARLWPSGKLRPGGQGGVLTLGMSALGALGSTARATADSSTAGKPRGLVLRAALALPASLPSTGPRVGLGWHHPVTLPSIDTSFATLDDELFNELLRLSRLYHREAKKCEAGKAYLAGCVMLGASLEAAVIGMVHCFPEEVAGCDAAPRKKGQLKPLLKWNLGQLVRVARELGWLPAGLRLEES